MRPNETTQTHRRYPGYSVTFATPPNADFDARKAITIANQLLAVLTAQAEPKPLDDISDLPSLSRQPEDRG